MSETDPSQPMLPYFQETIRRSVTEDYFRTLGSLVTEHGIPANDMRIFLESDPDIRKPWQQPQLDMYVASSRPVKAREFFSAFHASIVSRAPSNRPF